MNKNQILKAAGEYADKYEKENGFTAHPKTASFHGYIAGYDDAKLATGGDLEKELDELKAWKDRAMEVMSPIQDIGKSIGVKLGESIHDKILPFIDELKKDKERWKKTTERFKAEGDKWLNKSISQSKQIEELKAENERLKGSLKNLIFTASKLWDDAKPIKDTDIMKVTHPTIEEAKQILNK